MPINPLSEKLVRIVVLLPPDLVEQANQLAERNHAYWMFGKPSRAAVVRAALASFFAEPTVSNKIQNNPPGNNASPNVLTQRTLATSSPISSPDPTWVQPTLPALAEGNKGKQGESEAEATPDAQPPTPNPLQQRTLAAADIIARALAPQVDEADGGVA